MKIIGENTRKWFGYTRCERRATLALLAIIGLTYILRFLVPVKPVSLQQFDIYNVSSVKAADNLPGQNPDPSAEKENVNDGATRVAVPPEVQIQDTLFNLNLCDSTRLEYLPGIGPVLAARIVKYRNLLGGYSHKTQLREVYGLSLETYDLIDEKVFADSSFVKRIRINEASFTEMIRHPYFEKEEINLIIRYRETIGRINKIDDLTVNMIVTKEKALKISPYLSFE